MDNVDVLDARKRLKANNAQLKKGSKAWIVKKKEQMERKGKIVKATSKYTGRKRVGGVVFVFETLLDM
ncbi:hypothetical protein M440DRAFT_1422432 [Trichoderma longibrachiatum ATCC 18648]|uniref:18S rRNA (guanine(1575)-N(7))-methyltransferase Bud23 C-terminal domain-containing protein n=1 Tax=Trichoderma longibrachiatum ATCC 18648 TaxID=983965 RepID=A0A2T4C441_TRILO|nr:hypothetical protein M440DRAFT_1422432 [Trichoderma longibrachiatum ATCC 18648]